MKDKARVKEETTAKQQRSKHANRKSGKQAKKKTKKNTYDRMPGQSSLQHTVMLICGKVAGKVPELLINSEWA